MNLLPCRLLLGLLLALPIAAHAAPEPYASAAKLDLVALLPPPPQAGSAGEQADMQAVLDAQSGASEARRAQASADDQETLPAMFGAVLGAKFDITHLPLTAALFARLGKTESVAVDAAKDRIGRTRPWLVNPAIVGIGRPTRSKSYPSGHTSRVTLAAITLCAMLPELRMAIWARAAEFGESRVIAGRHYPTDVEAGTRSGTALATALASDASFHADRAAAAAELRAGLGLAATPDTAR